MATVADSLLRNMQLLDEGGVGGVTPTVRRDLSMLRTALTKQWVVLSPEEMDELKQRAQAVMQTTESPRTQLSAIALVLDMAKVNNQTADRVIRSLEVEDKLNEGHEDDETPKRPTVFTVDTIEDGQKVLAAMREGPVEVEYDDDPVSEVAAALDAIREESVPPGPVPVVESPPTPAPAPLAAAGHGGNGNGKPKRRLTY